MAGYREGVSRPGEGVARQSALLKLLDQAGGHQGVKLEAESLERFTIWMDTYAQRAGSFSPEQELELERLRRKWTDLLAERGPGQTASVETHE